MSKTAIGDKLVVGNWRLAIGSKPLALCSPSEATYLEPTVRPIRPQNSPMAYRQGPIACLSNANSFTVMLPVTSVTSQPLAESVLIRVGKVSPVGFLRGGIGSVLRLDSLLCAVTGGTCIK